MTPLAEFSCRDLSEPAASPGDASRSSASVCAGGISTSTCELAFVQRLIERDADAWQQFLDQYRRLIHSRVLAAGSELGLQLQEQTQEDTCAEILATLFRNDLAALRAFEGRSRLSTWLSVVSRRVALAYLLRQERHKARTKQPGTDFDLAAVANPDTEPGTSAWECPPEVLQDCLNQLKPADRQVIELQLGPGSSYRTMAEALGISENAVGPKLSRAQRRLKRLIESTRRSQSSPARPRKGGRTAP